MTYNQAPEACDECAGHVDEADAAPSCGAHRLHEWCAPWFTCRECEYVRSEVTC